MTEAQIRNAAEAFLHHGRATTFSQNERLTNVNPVYYDDQLASASHSLSSLDRIPGEDVVSGARTNGRMSVVRRFFCLFVLFDLLLTSLTWLICIMVSILIYKHK